MAAEGLAGSSAFVGRNAELDLLVHAGTKPPAFVLVEGEAGVGKTRLVREFLAHPALEGRRALLGHCHSLREPFPFGPVVEALRVVDDLPRSLSRVTGVLRKLLPELADCLPPAGEEVLDARTERHLRFRAVREVLHALGPAVCVLEDLHWIDASTGELLRFLVPQLPENLTLVVTYRREDLPALSPVLALTGRPRAGTFSTCLALAPLEPAGVRALIASLLGTDEVTEEFAAYVHARTAGLPFAVEEVLRLLEEQRSLIQVDGIWVRRLVGRLDVPAGVRDSILERLSHLPPDARRMAYAAAVLGVPAAQDLIAAVASLAHRRATKGLSGALRSALVHEVDDGRFDYRHVLARQTVYEAIPSPERRELHLLAALAMESAPQTAPPAQLAHHFKHAGRPSRSVRHAEAAADLAISLGDDAGACKVLQEVLATAGIPSTSRRRLALKLGKAAYSGLAAGETVAILRRILEEEPLAVGVRGELRLYHGLLLDNQAGQASSGRAEIMRAVSELRRRPGLAARGMALLASPVPAEGRVRDHIEWLDRAVETAARARDRALKTAVLASRASVLVHLGDPAGWQAVLDLPDDATSAEEKRELMRGYANVAYTAADLGHYARAESFLQKSRDMAAEIDFPYISASLDCTQVLIDLRCGRWDGLEPHVRQLVEVMADTPLGLAELQLVRGLLMVARGEFDEAQECLSSAAESALTGGSLPVATAAAAGLGRILLARKDAQTAAAEAVLATDRIRRKGAWVWAADVGPVAVEALGVSGRRSEAKQIVKEFAAGIRGRDAPAPAAALSVCRALLADPDDARESARLWSRAESGWMGISRPYEAARASEARARALLTIGDRQGEDVLHGSLNTFHTLGATWDAGRVRHTLRERGVALPSRAGRRGYGSRLSPREQEVVRLAATGRTNREIAEALFLSVRTVESHVASAMRKLGVASRRQLSRA